MDHLLEQNVFVLKRQGLSISGKYRLFDAEGKVPLLFIEEKSKWSYPFITYHVYADEKKTHEVLKIQDRPGLSANNMDIYDAQTDEKIGSLVIDADSWSEVFKEVWVILDGEEKPVGKVYEKSLSKSLLREMVSHDLPQQMDIKVGDIEVGELRQKIKPVSYELVIDLSKDVSALMDHRLAVAAALIVAYHQGKELDS
jgi:hypothetical protein